jgi:exosortase/archaeosortase
MDVSPGTQQQLVASNFPYGLPCVSDESQSLFMEAVYQQQPMYSNMTGVPVTISVIDSNNNLRDIGTATSNAMGTFGLTWTPDISGNYQVIASFKGSNSYYPSSSSTYLYAGETPTQAPVVTPASNAATASDVMTYLAAGVIAIIIAIAVVGLLILRKRP